MPRTSIQDITDIVHAWLLGVFCAYAAWAWLNRHVYSSSKLSRLNLVICVLMILRLMASIRLESSDSAACYFWILSRSTLSLFGIFALNIFFITELWLRLSIGISSFQKDKRRLWRLAFHGVTQGINVANATQYVVLLSAFTNSAAFCTLRGRDITLLTILTVISFTICLAMTVGLAMTKSMFMTSSPDIVRLFRVLTWSNILLCAWVVFIHLDSLLLQWQDWKSMNFTVMLVWMTVNSLLANNYLIHLRVKARSSTRASPAGSMATTASMTSLVLADAGADRSTRFGLSSVTNPKHFKLAGCAATRDTRSSSCRLLSIYNARSLS
ncbi:hypothetical protein BCR44DRAFT_403945 [Catenaria anguillulae PL171]|uniref:Uncharacterized protein n=1 Tax=Catenaria anguillulae PL171 TaxID=765915 RepID=A0A1Y2HQ89_9FUNG|nr:hypothetical protein BCR44DRAFT_403945 [Catenaria anguillulae PL171]